ncbi:MAG TPA: hypothetical protein VK864_13310, partial [Longimicrobiales bacterium]|nr:hypothetical protein [Longimicrobiales bacterium]
MRKILATTLILLISTAWLAAHSGTVNLITGTGIADKRDVAQALGVRPGAVDDLAPGLMFTLSDGVCTRT